MATSHPEIAHRAAEADGPAEMSNAIALRMFAELHRSQAYPFRPVARVGLKVDAPVSVIMAGVPEDP